MTPSCTLSLRTAVSFGALVILALARQAAAGGLSFVEYHAPPTPPANQGIRDVTGLVVSSGGDNLYTVSGEENALGVYTRNSATGAITFLEVHEDTISGTDDGLRSPTGVATTGDAKCVYVTSLLENKVAVFSRNAATGALTWVEVQENGVGGVSGLEKPQALAVSFDQKNVYVAAADTSQTEADGQGTVVAFSRAAPGCALTHVQTLDHVGNDARAIDVSYNDQNVYVGATYPTGTGTLGGVAVHGRNPATGELTRIETEYTGHGGPVRGVGASWDSGSVYATDDDAVVLFKRNPTTGAITFVESQHDGGVNDGLKGARGLAVSGDSGYVYVVGGGEQALAVFRRTSTDTTSDGLRFLEVQKDPNVDPPNDVLPGMVATTVFPGNVYVGGTGVTVFAVDSCGNGNRGPDEECDDGNFVAGDGCFLTCQLELCGPEPSSGCRGAAPRGAALTIRNTSPDTKDLLQWKWRGDATTIAEYGDPTSTASYAICMYDASGIVQSLLDAAAPAGGICAKGKPCWNAASKSYTYKDQLLTPDGIQLVKLREGLVDGKARIQIKGQSINLLPPTLPLTLPVTVQVKNTDTGICWEAVYTSADTNDATQFKAKSD